MSADIAWLHVFTFFLFIFLNVFLPSVRYRLFFLNGKIPNFEESRNCCCFFNNYSSFYDVECFSLIRNSIMYRRKLVNIFQLECVFSVHSALYL